MGLSMALGADGLIALFAEANPEMETVDALCIRLQCLAMPIHSWVAVVNMFCAGLGTSGGAGAVHRAAGYLLHPHRVPLAWLFGTVGVASVQAVVDALSLVLAIPIVCSVMKRVRKTESWAALEAEPVPTRTAQL